MFFQLDALALPDTLEYLPVEEGSYDVRLGRLELLLGKTFAVLRVEREV